VTVGDGLSGRDGAVESLDLFRLALGLQQPWNVTRTDFDAAASRLDLYLDFPRGARFACPVAGCGQGECSVHDTEDKTWRHMDFFQHKAYLHARVPRVRCAEHGVHQVGVSWARPESGFTLLFEALLITFATAMPVAKVAQMTREHDTRVWRVIEHHVDTGRALLSFAGVTKVGLDETAAARGQDYVTVFMDMVARRVLFATEGRDSATVARFAQDLREHGGDPALVTDTSSDMSVAFICGIGEHLPYARMTFDRFHVMAKLSEAVDEVRRAEQKTNPALKKTRYVWLKNQQNLTAKQRETLTWLTRPSMRLATARAHRWREDFQAFYDHSVADAETYLRRWCYGAKRSRLQPIKDFVSLVEDHWAGIIAWHRSRLSNGLLEGTNSLIQAAKARARGNRSKRKTTTIIYLIAAKLPKPSLYVTHTI
jgi:transposase